MFLIKRMFCKYNENKKNDEIYEEEEEEEEEDEIKNMNEDENNMTKAVILANLNSQSKQGTYTHFADKYLGSTTFLGKIFSRGYKAILEDMCVTNHFMGHDASYKWYVLVTMEVPNESLEKCITKVRTLFPLYHIKDNGKRYVRSSNLPDVVRSTGLLADPYSINTEHSFVVYTISHKETSSIQCLFYRGTYSTSQILHGLGNINMLIPDYIPPCPYNFPLSTLDDPNLLINTMYYVDNHKEWFPMGHETHDHKTWSYHHTHATLENNNDPMLVVASILKALMLSCDKKEEFLVAKPVTLKGNHMLFNDYTYQSARLSRHDSLIQLCTHLHTSTQMTHYYCYYMLLFNQHIFDETGYGKLVLDIEYVHMNVKTTSFSVINMQTKLRYVEFTHSAKVVSICAPDGHIIMINANPSVYSQETFLKTLKTY